MKFISSMLLGAAALANVALADSEEFNFLGLRSGSKFHFSSVHADNGALKLGGKGEALSAVITDNGKLRLSDGKYAVVTASGPIIEGSEQDASTGFSVAEGYLKYAGNSAFVPISVGDSYELSVRPMDPSDIAISIRAQSKTNVGAAIPDFLANL